MSTRMKSDMDGRSGGDRAAPMSERGAGDRLRRTRRAVVIGTVARATLIAAATALTTLLLVAAIDLLVGVPLAARTALRALALLAALVAGARALLPLRHARSIARVALWVEEHVPHLRYQLVTLAEQDAARHAEMLEQRVARVGWEPVARAALARALLAPAAVALVAGALLLLVPASTLARVAAPEPGDAVDRRGAAADTRSVLETLVASVTPPAYTGEPRRTIEEPTLVAALTGSRLELRGRGDAARLTAIIDGRRQPARGGDGMWTLTVPVAGKPFAVLLRDSTAGAERIVAVEPQPDAVPRVTLESPARDTVMRVAAGRIPLRAQALDDFGLASLRFEWIVSAGEGENFTFRSGSTMAPGNGARSRAFTATLSLDSLQLTPGSIVHVRAVARDRNTAAGPGEGASETRMLRVARASEYDSLGMELAGPPEADKSALSQRMLIMQTEALEKRRPRLDRRTLVREATAIALDQARLRKRVGEIVFQRLTGEDAGEHSHEDLTPEQLLEHAAAEAGVGAPPGHGDEAPIIAINAPLLEAYNAMWEAQTSLALAELREALPPMYRALDAIQRARAAERLYLRGRAPDIVIDLARVRLTGERPASTGARTARSVAATQRSLEARFARALALATRDAAAAADSLTLLRLDVIGGGAEARPAFAAALAEAASRLRGRDPAAAEAALRAASRAMAGEPRTSAGLAPWGGGW